MVIKHDARRPRRLALSTDRTSAADGRVGPELGAESISGAALVGVLCPVVLVHRPVGTE